MKLALRGTNAVSIGYGTFIANLDKGFRDLGVEAEWSDGPVPADAETVLWATVPNTARGGWANQHTACFTMWEATRLPEAFRETFAWMDQMFVPCAQNVELFSRHHPDVTKVPLGYDADTWRYVDRDGPEEEFRFLCAGQTLSTQGGRKGYDIAVRAFRLAFPGWKAMNPRPVLITKSHKPVEPVEFATNHVGRTSPEELAALVASCHAYVGPSRGEGWGYWPQQAIATGMPVIMSAIPAHLEFGWMPGFTTVPVTETKADYFAYGNAGNWWDTDIDALVDAMRDVFANWERHHLDAKAGADTMARTYTHRHMAAEVLEHMRVGKPGGRWLEFTPALYPTTVTRRALCDIGETRYDLAPGVHALCADAQRVLQEAGFAEATA